MKCITITAQYEYLVKPKILTGEFSKFHDTLVLLVGLDRLPKIGAIPFSVPIWNFTDIL